MLYSLGFQSAEEIAVKVVNLFDLCSDQYPASPRDHAWLAG